MTTLTDVSAGRRTGSTHSAERKLDTAALIRAAVADCATDHARKSPAPKRRTRHHIPGCNPDATPC